MRPPPPWGRASPAPRSRSSPGRCAQRSGPPTGRGSTPHGPGFSDRGMWSLYQHCRVLPRIEANYMLERRISIRVVSPCPAPASYRRHPSPQFESGAGLNADHGSSGTKNKFPSRKRRGIKARKPWLLVSPSRPVAKGGTDVIRSLRSGVSCFEEPQGRGPSTPPPDVGANVEEEFRDRKGSKRRYRDRHGPRRTPYFPVTRGYRQ